MKLRITISGPDKIVNRFAGDIVRNSPPEIEADFSSIEIVDDEDEDEEPQHEHLKDTEE